MEKVTDEGIRYCFVSPNESDANMEEANVVDGLYAIARSLRDVAEAIHALGNNHASTSMGAIEALGLVVKDSLSSLASSMERLPYDSDGTDD